jgi:hypothetical protein
MSRIAFLSLVLTDACAVVEDSTDGEAPGLGPGPGGNDGDGDPACSDADCAARCVAAGFAGGGCSVGTCACWDTEAGERCDDGLDNNGNGAVDEGCPCTPGETKPCYVGPPATRGQGTCRDSAPSCVGDGEFGSWGDCTGQVLPVDEACNGLDDDCDLAVDEGCGPK